LPKAKKEVIDNIVSITSFILYGKAKSMFSTGFSLLFINRVVDDMDNL